MITAEDTNELDPSKKGHDYCVRNAKSIHASNQSGISANFFNQKAKWQLNRKYARGEQPINNTKTVLNRDKDVQFDSLNWTVPKVMPKIFDILIGMISRLPTDISCDSIDSESIDKKVVDRYRKEAEIMLAEEIAQMEDSMGVKLRDPNNTYTDPEELDIAIEDGDFKVEVEIAMEELIDVLFDYNRIKELVIMLTDDIANCGMGILRHYVQANGLIKVKRVQPELFVTDYVQSRDFREMSRCGEYYFVHFRTLRELAGDQFTDAQYINIAENMQGKYGNPTFTTQIGTNLASYANASGGFIFDNYIVAILHSEWASTDRYTHIKDKPNKIGNNKTLQMPVGYKSDNRNKPYTKTTDYTVWYNCDWILDTEWAFDCGPLQFPNVQANQLNESQSTFAVCAMKMQDMITSTITERVQAIMDNIVLNWMQYQSHLAKAVPPGIYAEMMALSNVSNGKGGQAMKPLEIIERYVSTGNLVGNSMLPNGQVLQRAPVEELKGSDLSKIQFFWAQIIQGVDLIKQMVGLNDATDASNPNPEQSVGGAKLAVQGTNNSLQPIITCLDNIIEKTAEGIVNRCQHMASKGQLDYLANAIGRKSLMALAITEDLSTAALAIKVQPRMDETDRMYLEQNIQQGLAQRSQTGVGGIEVEDAIAIRRQKNVKSAERMLILRRRKRAMEDAKRSETQQQQNAQVQQASIQATSQAKMQEIQADLMAYQEKKKIDLQALDQEEAIKLKYKKEELVLQGHIKNDNILTQGTVDQQKAIVENEMNQKSDKTE